MNQTLLGLGLSTADHVGWLPPAASSAAAGVDRVFAIVFWISAFFFALIITLSVVFVVRYRARRWSAPEPSGDHNTKLELLWSAIPLVLVLGMFGTATASYLELTQPPTGPMEEIHVTARKWSWAFEHPGGKTSNELHVVMGRSVRLTMAAQDVLHSLYIPAFRIKQDVVPGRYTQLWFKAIQPGTFPIFCAEYCGTNHSTMTSSVVVHKDQREYDAWLASQDTSALPLLEVGKRVYVARGCNACHSDDGSPRTAPTFKGMWGKSEIMTDGSSAVVDENYVKDSILNPRAKVVIGYQPIMPPTALEGRELLGVIELLKSLK